MTTAARRRGALCAVVAVIAMLAGCSSGPSAAEWAGQVCDALGPWRTQIAELNTQAQQQMANATTPTQTRDNLVALVSGAETATEKAREAIDAAGVPDVDGGADVARSFVTALGGTRDAYAKARSDLRALSTADPAAFYDEVVKVLARLNIGYVESGVDPTSLSSPELKQAFAGIASCR